MRRVKQPESNLNLSQRKYTRTCTYDDTTTKLSMYSIATAIVLKRIEGRYCEINLLLVKGSSDE